MVETDSVHAADAELATGVDVVANSEGLISVSDGDGDAVDRGLLRASEMEVLVSTGAGSVWGSCTDSEGWGAAMCCGVVGGRLRDLAMTPEYHALWLSSDLIGVAGRLPRKHLGINRNEGTQQDLPGPALS